MKRRVVVTGMGAITPLGNDIDTFWSNIKSKKVPFKPIKYFDAREYKSNLAAHIEDFAPEDFMDKKTARRIERFSQFAVAAARQAVEDSNMDFTKEDMTRIGVSIATGIGGIGAIEREYKKILTRGPKRVSPLTIPLLISNMVAGNVSIQFGIKGKSINNVTACAAGTSSIGEAYRAIQYGEADVMLAGGTETPITPTGIAGFDALNALNTSSDPRRASIPFDKERNGFVISEGAGVVVLESLDHALARKATIYAEIGGYGSTSDAYHLTSPEPEGEGAARAMSLAIAEAGIEINEIDYVNAHGTSTQLNDLYETKAIKKVLGDHAYKINVNSTKSMLGHMIAGAGAVEFIVCVKSILDNYVHATVGYEIPDEELDLNYTQEAETDKEINNVITNSLGFGGHNGSILLQRFDKKF